MPALDEFVDDLPISSLRIDDGSVVGHIAGPYAPRLPTTFYAGVSRSAPVSGLGSDTVVDLDLSFDPARVQIARNLTLEDAGSQLRDLLIEVVGDYITRDRAAITVSSGMDSTSVLAALSHHDLDLIGVTWALSGTPEADEVPWARLSAERFDLDLRVMEVDPETLLPPDGVVTRRSTPLVNIFDPVWALTASRMAEEDRKVLYTGFSGDHLFGGRVSPAGDLLLSLRWFSLIAYLRRVGVAYQSIARTVRSELVSPLLRQVVPGLWIRRRRPVPWLHPSRLELWRQRQFDIIGPGIRPGRAERISRLTDGVIAQLSESLESPVSSHGVELRHPLLDERLVEFALTLPTWMLNDGRLDKLILRKAMQGLLPEEVVDLENIAPGAAARRAVRARKNQLIDLTRGMKAAEMGYVDEAVLTDHVGAFMVGKHDDMSFWNTLTLEDWLRRWW